MDAAAQWLECNEGELGEADECAAVAKWLRGQISAAEIRAIAKEVGVSTAVARRALKRKSVNPVTPPEDDGE